jgi:hypothetical protein
MVASLNLAAVAVLGRALMTVGDVRLGPDLLRGRGKSIGGHHDINDEGSE